MCRVTVLIFGTYVVLGTRRFSNPYVPKVITTTSAQFSSYNTNLKMSTGDFRVADISLADFGRKEIEIAEHEVIT